MDSPKIIAIDDDPTGSQTVHSCPLLMTWAVETLRRAIRDPSPVVFVLSNARAVGAAEARRINREICTNLDTALRLEGFPPTIIVSRSDSTLRGHFPDECDEIRAVLGPFDALFFVPAFFEAGRVTIDGDHYIRNESRLTRADKTPFARDSVFGYTTSFLPGYIEEKTGGRVAASEVVVLPRGLDRTTLTSRIDAAPPGSYVVVDAEEQADLDLFASVVLELSRLGKRFLFRSAASLVTSLAALPPQPVDPVAYGALVPPGRTGVVVCGSHVPLATRQIANLLETDDVIGIEIDVDAVKFGSADRVIDDVSLSVAAAAECGETPVVYTSRTERRDMAAEERLALGDAISRVIVGVVRRLPVRIGFIVSKGGITSHVTLKDGLDLDSVRVSGQIAPGCSVVVPPSGHRYAGVPVVIFPGNVGGEETLREVVETLRQRR